MQWSWQAYAMLAGVLAVGGVLGYYTHWWVGGLFVAVVVGGFFLWLGAVMNTDI